jgi:hypothetical protein
VEGNVGADSYEKCFHRNIGQIAATKAEAQAEAKAEAEPDYRGIGIIRQVWNDVLLAAAPVGY